MERIRLPFKPRHVVSVKMPPSEPLAYDVILGANKGQCLMITGEGRREVAPSGSLGRILQHYSEVTECFPVGENLMILSVYYANNDVTHLLLVEIDTSESIKFIQRDAYKMKPKKTVNCIEV